MLEIHEFNGSGLSILGDWYLGGWGRGTACNGAGVNQQPPVH
jgi:hypothetical protein